MKNLGLYGAWLTVNRFCNFRCLWCYALDTHFRKEDDMPRDLALDLVDFLAELGLPRILLIGGETLFYPHLFDVVGRIKRHKMQVVVITNGYLLSSDRFMDKFTQAGVDAVNVSIKAGSSQQHQELTLTRPFAWERVLQGITNLASAKIPFEVSVIANSFVLNNLVEIARLAVENGADRFAIDFCTVSFEGERPVARYMPDLTEVVHMIVKQYPAIHEITKGELHISNTIPRCLWPADFLALLDERDQASYGCHVTAREGLVWDGQGRLIPCNHMYDYPMGQFGVDFDDRRSFIDFWQQPELVEFYDQMIAYPAQRCIPCAEYAVCSGGCPLHWFVYDPEVVLEGGEVSVQASKANVTAQHD